jgi:hypothetical protein
LAHFFKAIRVLKIIPFEYILHTSQDEKRT